ncbi:dihydrolipoamide acetyltransferase family protein [Nocardioides sp. 503]|uniref:dihydrolipoamide acetyltransferase family protein n=1 Tax=Nocardioides sp. 503 TaxID=2508326 RepID=UPI0010705D98|nr:dihydrolipoamide acetyltransferase family protein [Nocardioides sp. 503]
MATVLRMPEVAAAATEAVLTEWLLAEGATFSAGDALATVETEKALVDIEADSDGTLLKLLVPGGQLTDVGAPIAVLAAVGEEITDLGAILGDLGIDQDPESGAPVMADVEAPVVEEGRTPLVEEGRSPVSKPNPVGRIFSSPLARKIAKDAGLALEDIPGTGPRNRVLRRDVEAALAARITEAAAPLVEEGRSPVSKPTPATTSASTSTGYDEIPHTRLREAIAARLQQSKREAPHFYLRATIRADRLVALRSEINEGADVRISLNDLVLKAVAGAHLAVPEMNATWTDDAVRRPHSVDIAVAVATERGLVTPVVRDVPSLTVRALAAKVQDLATRARDGKLKQDELEGGTISVTNLGMYAVEDFAAIINPPHAAILAVGAVRDEPVVQDGQLVVGKTLKVTLSVDHRPVDGVVAAQWLKAFVDLLEHPARALA